MDKVRPFKKIMKGERNMSTAVLKKEETSYGNMAEIKKLIQTSMQENKISSVEARKSLDIKRYEK
ncbi:MAG: hypothetical protein ACOYVD_17160 [Bacillota bacterium]